VNFSPILVQVQAANEDGLPADFVVEQLFFSGTSVEQDVDELRTRGYPKLLDIGQELIQAA